MGLRRDIQEINSTLSKSEIARIKREQEKRLEEDYKRDLQQTLKNEMLDRLYPFEKYKNNLSKLIDNKGEIVCKVADKMLSIKTKENKVVIKNDRYVDVQVDAQKYKTSFSAIIEDAEDIFYKVLANVQKEYKLDTSIEKDNIQDLCYKELKSAVNEIIKEKMKKEVLLKSISSLNVMDATFNELGIEHTEENEEEYFKALNRVKKYVKTISYEEKEPKKEKLCWEWKFAIGAGILEKLSRKWGK